MHTGRLEKTRFPKVPLIKIKGLWSQFWRNRGFLEVPYRYKLNRSPDKIRRKILNRTEKVLYGDNREKPKSIKIINLSKLNYWVIYDGLEH